MVDPGLFAWLATAIAALVALGVVVADALVRRRRRMLVARLGLDLDLETDSQLTEGLARLVGDRGWYVAYLPGAFAFVAVSTVGLLYVLFPSEAAPFLRHNYFLLSGNFASAVPPTEGQARAAVALFAGFIGAYAWSIRHFFLEIDAGRFSPHSLLLATGALVGGSLGTLVLWHVLAALGPGELLVGNASALFAAAAVAGYVIARPLPAKLAERVAALVSLDRVKQHLIPLESIYGLDHAARRRLMFLQISDVQNLATANPLLLYAATSFTLNAIIDWIGQARLALRVEDPEKLSMLQQLGVRTIFDFIDVAQRAEGADRLAQILLPPTLLRAPRETTNAAGPEPPDRKGADSSQAIVIRLAENEQDDPAFQRVDLIRRAAQLKALPPPGATSSAISEATSISDHGTPREVVRYPEIGMQRWRDGDAVRVAFSIDLRADCSGETGASDWADLAVTVRVLCRDVDLDEDEGVVIVRPYEASTPCRLLGELRADGVALTVRALFYYRSRFCGSLARSFSLASPVGAAVAKVAGEEEASPALNLVGTPPDLTVEITIDPRDRTKQTWRMRSERLQRKRGYHGRNLGDATLQGTEEFLASFQDTLRTAGPEQMRDRLKGMGLKLYRRAPEAFKEAYWFLRDARDGGAADFSIQIIAEDGVAPFELMVPEREGREFDHLLVTHPIARWVLARDRSTPDLEQHIPSGKIGIVLPRYGKLRTDVEPLGNYPEIERAYKRLKAHIVDGVSSNFKSLMSAKLPLSILVYHGHGAAGAGQAARLLLEDSDVLNTEIDTAETTLGTRHHTLVLLNACRTGGQTISLGSVDGWTTTLVQRNFGGVIAPLWDVESEEAHHFAMDLISALRAGKPMGIAMRELRTQSTPSALAYVCYADVAARLG